MSIRTSEDFSGIIATQTGTSPYIFALPHDYIRTSRGANALVPPLTGFQVYLTVDPGTRGAASVIWTVSHNNLPLFGDVAVGAAGEGQVWFSVYFEPIDIDPNWVNDSFQISVSCSDGAHTPTRIRVLAGVVDGGTDFLGNTYRSSIIRAPASSVSVLADESSFWLSHPSPSSFGVQALYFDVRNAGGTNVIDRFTIDPLTPNVRAHLYYSNDPTGPGVDAETWDNLLWTPIYQPLQLATKETYALPRPISAKYIKLEFSNLQAMSYDPGPYQIPTAYRKHPKWVLEYFLAQFSNLDRDLLSSSVAVTYDALDLAYTYYKDDLIHEPAPPVLSQETPDQVNFLRPANSGTGDAISLNGISLNLQPFGTEPGLQGDTTTVLGRVAASNSRGGNYSTETILDVQGDTSTVSNLQREALLVEKGMPPMFFFLPCRHGYRFAKALFQNNVGYFAGVKSVAFHREVYSVPRDRKQYNEIIADNENAVINDFLA